MDVSKELQIKRLKARNPAKLEAFKSVWIPREEKYFDTCKIRESCDMIITAQLRSLIIKIIFRYLSNNLDEAMQVCEKASR